MFFLMYLLVYLFISRLCIWTLSLLHCLRSVFCLLSPFHLCVKFCLASIFLAIYTLLILPPKLSFPFLLSSYFCLHFFSLALKFRLPVHSQPPSQVTQQYRQQHFFRGASFTAPFTKGRCTRQYPMPDGDWWPAPLSRREVLLYMCA